MVHVPFPVPHKQQKIILFAEGYGLYLEFHLRFGIASPAYLVKGGDLSVFIHHDKLDNVTYVPFDAINVRPGYGAGLGYSPGILTNQYVHRKGFGQRVFRRFRGTTVMGLKHPVRRTGSKLPGSKLPFAKKPVSFAVFIYNLNSLQIIVYKGKTKGRTGIGRILRGHAAQIYQGPDR
jgi:hypothetical protein